MAFGVSGQGTVWSCLPRAGPGRRREAAFVKNDLPTRSRTAYLLRMDQHHPQDAAIPPTAVQVPVAVVRLDGPGQQPGVRAVAV